MKTPWKSVLVAVTLLIVSDAHAMRWYSPNTGRWFSRDPIEERGGLNMYGFVRNNPANRFDRLGLTDFSHIDGDRLIYSCNCGWIDLGHAGLMDRQIERGSAAQKSLWETLTKENGQPSDRGGGFKVCLGESMGPPNLGDAGGLLGVRQCFYVKDGLTDRQKECVAIAILKSVSLEFEKLQSSFPYNKKTDSGFSEEDLPSNLLGLMSVMRGYNKEQVLSLCGALTKEQSKQIWKANNGLGKNHDFKPVLKPCEPCKGERKWPFDEPDCKGVDALYRKWETVPVTILGGGGDESIYIPTTRRGGF